VSKIFFSFSEKNSTACFTQAKFAYGGLVLSLSQFWPLSQFFLNLMLGKKSSQK
jgi:hypothetical protein